MIKFVTSSQMASLLQAAGAQLAKLHTDFPIPPVHNFDELYYNPYNNKHHHPYYNIMQLSSYVCFLRNSARDAEDGLMIPSLGCLVGMTDYLATAL
jgi:hypothetical protein